MKTLGLLFIIAARRARLLVRSRYNTMVILEASERRSNYYLDWSRSNPWIVNVL